MGYDWPQMIVVCGESCLDLGHSSLCILFSVIDAEYNVYVLFDISLSPSHSLSLSLHLCLSLSISLSLPLDGVEALPASRISDIVISSSLSDEDIQQLMDVLLEKMNTNAEWQAVGDNRNLIYTSPSIVSPF